MSYESPIKLIEDMNQRFQLSVENNVYQAVLNIGVDVDKAELIRALEYDREQYYHGCQDERTHIITALMDLRDAWIAKQPRSEWYKDKTAQGVEQGIEMAIQKVREMAERREDG